MTARPVLRGGIIAAGKGSRLRAAGWRVPKAMVPVAGVPLIEAVIGNFVAAGIRSLSVIVNEDSRACAAWLAARFDHLDLRLTVRTTASSLESFLEVASAPESGPMLISTVDAWCRPEDFARFEAAARRRPAGSTVLAVTPLVADEKPLWVRHDGEGRVTDVNGSAGDLVTAGIYLVPEMVRRGRPPAGLARLRDFFGWLHRSGAPLYAERIETVVDVDRAEDVAHAERLALAPGGGAV
ncbi:MAG: NTP transferase domain-containing protein [Candidatus Rokubacteria bacterium]|nr:NTP transferase domain-containing protein [Candidatus Rokubacteria bacterium]